MTICERVDEILQARGISRRKLAITAGIPPSTFQTAMSRNKDLSIDTLFKISDILGVSVEFLMTGFEQDPIDLPEDWPGDSIEKSNSPEALIMRSCLELNSLGLEKAADFMEIIAGNPKYRTSQPPQAPSSPDSETTPEDK